MIALLGGCSEGGTDFTAHKSDVAGVWRNSKGAKIEFRADGTFSAEQIDKALPLRNGCADMLKQGNWHLMNTSGVDTQAGVDASTTVAVNPPGREAAAACGLQAGVRKDSDGINLCVVEDPDQTCSSDELLRHSRS